MKKSVKILSGEGRISQYLMDMIETSKTVDRPSSSGIYSSPGILKKASSPESVRQAPKPTPAPSLKAGKIVSNSVEKSPGFFTPSTQCSDFDYEKAFAESLCKEGIDTHKWMSCIRSELLRLINPYVTSLQDMKQNAQDTKEQYFRELRNLLRLKNQKPKTVEKEEVDKPPFIIGKVSKKDSKHVFSKTKRPTPEIKEDTESLEFNVSMLEDLYRKRLMVLAVRAFEAHTMLMISRREIINEGVDQKNKHILRTIFNSWSGILKSKNEKKELYNLVLENYWNSKMSKIMDRWRRLCTKHMSHSDATLYFYRRKVKKSFSKWVEFCLRKGEKRTKNHLAEMFRLSKIRVKCLDSWKKSVLNRPQRQINFVSQNLRDHKRTWIQAKTTRVQHQIQVKSPRHIEDNLPLQMPTESTGPVSILENTRFKGIKRQFPAIVPEECLLGIIPDINPRDLKTYLNCVKKYYTDLTHLSRNYHLINAQHFAIDQDLKTAGYTIQHYRLLSLFLNKWKKEYCGSWMAHVYSTLRTANFAKKCISHLRSHVRAKNADKREMDNIYNYNLAFKVFSYLRNLPHDLERRALCYRKKRFFSKWILALHIKAEHLQNIIKAQSLYKDTLKRKAMVALDRFTSLNIKKILFRAKLIKKHAWENWIHAFHKRTSLRIVLNIGVERWKSKLESEWRSDSHMLSCIVAEWRSIVIRKGSRKERNIKKLMASNFRKSRCKIKSFFSWKKYINLKKGTILIGRQLRKYGKRIIKKWKTFADSDALRYSEAEIYYREKLKGKFLKKWVHKALKDQIATQFVLERIFKAWKNLFVYKEKNLPLRWHQYQLLFKGLKGLKKNYENSQRRIKAEELKEYHEVRSGIAAVKAVLAILYKNLLMAKTKKRKLRIANHFYIGNLVRKSVFVWKHKVKARKHKEAHRERRKSSLKLCFSVLKAYAHYCRERKAYAYVFARYSSKVCLFRAFDTWKKSFENISWMDNILYKEQRLRKELEYKLDQLKVNLFSF